MKRVTDNTDYIAIMSDDELNNKLRRIERDLSRINDDKYASRDTASEVDLCYYQREAEVRLVRRQRHEAWLSRNSS